MALDRGIIRFQPEGPTEQGLAPMVEITPDMLVAVEASELCHNYYTSPSGVLTAGVWEVHGAYTRIRPVPRGRVHVGARRLGEHRASG